MNNNIEKYLNENHMNQRELSRKSGISETSISRYIKGIRIPNAIDAITIANCLNCTVEDLYNEKESKEEIKYIIYRVIGDSVVDATEDVVGVVDINPKSFIDDLNRSKNSQYKVKKVKVLEEI